MVCFYIETILSWYYCLFLYRIYFKPSVNCFCAFVDGMFAMLAKRTITRPTTQYGSSKCKGWTAVCGLNPSTFRNTIDRNSIMKSCFWYTCPVPLWPDIRHYSRMDDGYRKGPKLQLPVPAWGKGWQRRGVVGGERGKPISFRVRVPDPESWITPHQLIVCSLWLGQRWHQGTEPTVLNCTAWFHPYVKTDLIVVVYLYTIAPQNGRGKMRDLFQFSPLFTRT